MHVFSYLQLEIIWLTCLSAAHVICKLKASEWLQESYPLGIEDTNVTLQSANERNVIFLPKDTDH